MIHRFINTHVHTERVPSCTPPFRGSEDKSLYLNPLKSPCLPHPCWRLGAPERDPQVKKPRMYAFLT